MIGNLYLSSLFRGKFLQLLSNVIFKNEFLLAMYSTLEVIFQVNFTSSANYPPFQTNKNKILKKDTAKVGSGCQKLIASS